MTWQLIVETGKKRGLVVAVKQACFWIGRARTCDLRPGSRAVSRRHCALRANEDQLFVAPAPGAAPTLVNGRAVNQETELLPGDQLQVGPLVFHVWVMAPPSSPRFDDDEVANLLLAMDAAPAPCATGQETVADMAQATVAEQPVIDPTRERRPISTSSAAERLLEKYARRSR